MSYGPFGDDDDGPDLSEQLEAEQQPSTVRRTQDGECDECGVSEGSLIEHKEEGWRLCREHYNDSDTLEKHHDG